jgi:hypothetical protein
MTDIAVITIHIHPDLPAGDRERLEQEVSIFDGVTLARFNHKVKHWLSVVYDSDSITAWKILTRVKQWDKNAVFY